MWRFLWLDVMVMQIIVFQQNILTCSFCNSKSYSNFLTNNRKKNTNGNTNLVWGKLLALDESEGTWEKTESSTNCANVSANLRIWVSHCHVQCSVKHTSKHGHLSITVIFGNLYPLTDELLTMKKMKGM